jgi:hypothetical protein
MKKANLRRFVSATIGIGVVLATALFASAQGIYTFEGLTQGKLGGQDNWTSSANGFLELGAGINTSLVFNNTTAGLPQGTGSRVNNAQFSFPTLRFEHTNVVFGFDFRLKSTAANCSADFLLAERDHAFTDHGKIGLRYDPTRHQVMIIRGDGTAVAGTQNNFPDAVGSWFRVWMSIDFSAYSGDASANLYIKNLSAAEQRFTPVTPLQNISLLLVSQGVDSARWDRMDVRSANIQVDNLVIGFTTNAAPVMETIADQTVAEGELLTLAVVAADPDGAADGLRFTLDPGAPTGASITPAGIFTWTPTATQGPAAYWVSVRVTDNGFPPKAAVRQFKINVFEINHPPAPASPVLNRSLCSGVKVRAAELLGTDPDGDELSLSSLDALSAAGGSIALAEGWVIYTPPAAGASDDSFGYTVTDDLGAVASGLVTMVLATNSEPSLNLTWESLIYPKVLVRGDGIPERSYLLEFTEGLTPPAWQPLGIVIPDPLGRFEFLDQLPPGAPARTYRTRCL